MRRVAASARTAVRTAWSGLRTSPVTSGVAVITIAVALLLVGAFALLVTNMERILDRFGEELRVSAYLAPGLAPEAQEALRARVADVPGVLSVALVTRDEALARFRESRVARAALLDGLEENPLPASLEVSLEPAERTREGLAALNDELADLPGIEELGYGHGWVEGYARALGVVRAAALALGLVLGLAALLIVANTIRLAVYARRDEIEILRLVGASRAFVAAPFVLEGLIQGLVGGLIALGLLALFHVALVPSLRGGMELLLGDVTPVFLAARGMLTLVLGGAALGALGSAAALVQGES